MNIPPRILGSMVAPLSNPQLSGPTGSSFASKLGAVGSSIAQTALSVGKEVLKTAVPGGGVLANLASNLVPGAGDDLEMVDKARQFAMQNAIFDAANAPTVERE